MTIITLLHTSLNQFTHLGRRYYSDCNLMSMFLDCYPGMFWCHNKNDSQFILNCLRIKKRCHVSLTMNCILIMTHKKYFHFIEIIYLCIVMKACRNSLSFCFILILCNKNGNIYVFTRCQTPCIMIQIRLIICWMKMKISISIS